MKKEKFKIKSKKRVFGTKFITLLLVAVLLAISTTYAMFTERLTITGTVTGNLAEYTYYFRNSKNWSGDIYAYVFNRSSSSDTGYGSWPGTKMTYNSSTGLYGVTFSGNVSHNYIIFNNGDGGGSQTDDIAIVPFNVNNSVFDPTGSYNRPGYQRLIFNTEGNWSTVYAYLYNSDSDKLESWPGVRIDRTNKLSNNYYFIETERNRYKYIIFNNGNGGDNNQTVNLVIPHLSDALCKRSNVNYVNNSKNNPYLNITVNTWLPYSDSSVDSTNKKIIYFKPPSDWSSDIHAYFWGSNGDSEAWPGPAMTNISGTDLYYVDASNTSTKTYTSIVFNDNNGTTYKHKTGDLTLVSSSNYIYTMGWTENNLATGSWRKITMTSPTPSHSHSN